MSKWNSHSHQRHGFMLVVGFIFIAGASRLVHAAPANITFSQSAQTIEAYDFVEITLNVSSPDAQNPFLDVAVEGQFGKAGSSQQLKVSGFCDSADGSVFRIRFMPSATGDYTYSLVYRQGSFEKTHAGAFRATDGHRRGPIRVDPQYPWHFVWEGTGEHYYFNGTTAFWLVGWRDERNIDYSIERLHSLKINRMRVLISGAANIYWGEPVMTAENFSLILRPWMARDPESFDHPEIDFTHFNVPYWQKWERMLRFARDRDMIISAILDISTHKAQPAAGSEDERRYIRYAVARFGAFSNFTYDLGDDLDSFPRREVGARNRHPDRELGPVPSPRHQPSRASRAPGPRLRVVRLHLHPGLVAQQHALMLEERQIQMKTGRIIPQTNEEYGYEDHYPQWAPPPPGDSAEVLRQMAWQIAMAGAYGTAGESCAPRHQHLAGYGRRMD